MDRALWLLLGFRFWSWLRRLGRNVATVKGAVLAALGTVVFLFWLVPAVFVRRPAADAAHLEQVRLYGPLALAAYCLLTLLTSGAERAVSFSPAEVNFLFAGPFSRRQLLAYKMVTSCSIVLLTAIIFTLVFRSHAALALAAYVGLVLALVFLQLFAMALTLLASTVGARAYSRRRKIVLMLLAAALLIPLLQKGKSLLQRPDKLPQQVLESPVWQTVVAPLRWFVQAFTAERLWPDLVHWSLLGLAVNAALVVILLALDAHYMETAAAVGEKIYARMQRLRGGGVMAVAPGSGRARFSLPLLPWWGGIGPIAWRQFLTALRQLTLLVVLVIMVLMITGTPVMAVGLDQQQQVAVIPVLGSLLLMTSVFFGPLVRFDFRGDLDRMEVLKTLPIAAWRLALGQLVAPTLIVSVIQAVAAGALQAILGRLDGVLLAIGLFALPLNALLFGIENLIFLWFPSRPVQSTPGDLQGLGRNVLIYLAKFVALGATLTIAALAALVAWAVAHLLGGPTFLAAGATAWLTLTALGLALVPLIGLAFRQFDVARDTPP